MAPIGFQSRPVWMKAMAGATEFELPIACQITAPKGRRTSKHRSAILGSRGHIRIYGREGFPADWSQLQIRPRASPRVRDVTLLKSQLLYQLSYAGAPVIVFAESSAACRRSHGRPSALLSKLLSNPKTVVKPQGVERGKLLMFPELLFDAN